MAVRYMARRGCQWGWLPKHLPASSNGAALGAMKGGTLAWLNRSNPDLVRGSARLEGREPSPCAGWGCDSPKA